MKHTVLGSLFVLLAVMLLRGDVLLLLFTSFIEIFVGVILVINVVYLGHKEVKGIDYRGFVLDLGLLIPIVLYAFFGSYGHIFNLINLNFDGSIFSSWKFWGVLFSVILSQLYIFIQTFILNEDYRLPSPSFYIMDLLARSFALIVATSAFWTFFNSLTGMYISVFLFFIVKMFAELFMKYTILDAGLAKGDHQYLFRRQLRAKFFY